MGTMAYAHVPCVIAIIGLCGMVVGVSARIGKELEGMGREAMEGQQVLKSGMLDF